MIRTDQTTGREQGNDQGEDGMECDSLHGV